jgi:hypothetical protein
LRGEYEAATRSLERAKARGWRLRWWMRRDPGLAGLRERGMPGLD